MDDFFIAMFYGGRYRHLICCMDIGETFVYYT